MHNLDYELGFVSEEDWENAEGRGAAKAVFIGCNIKCTALHPFSKSKRNKCKDKCAAAYAGKMSVIEGMPSEPEYIPPPPPPTPPPTPPTGGGTGANLKLSNGESGEKKAGLGTGAMIGIGVGVLALLMIGGFMIMRKK